MTNFSTLRRARRRIALFAIGALLANVSLPWAAVAARPAAADGRFFPICSAHAALLGQDPTPPGKAPAGDPPLSCPLCPPPMPQAAPAAPVVPQATAIPIRSVYRTPAPETGHPARKPLPVWSHAPPVFS